MKQTDVMIDIETLGTAPGCVVLSIGACTFNRNTGEIGDTFYIEINRYASINAGLTVDDNTQHWWNQQGEEAKALLDRTRRNSEETTPIYAISELVNWFCLSIEEPGATTVWANDPTFDLAILAPLFAISGATTPWAFWCERSCRTIVDIGQQLGTDPKRTLPFTGTKHNALDDAIHQAKYVSAIFQHLNALKAA